MLKKIVIVGPESTGKSSLCEALSQHFRTIWCREYAREYLLKNGTQYSLDDLLTIAKGQWALEDRTVKEAQENGYPYLFIDTDQYVMKVWCEFVFGDCHTWILNRVVDQQQDLYLLCKPDLPWVADELREYPNEKPRQELYHIYRDMLIEQDLPWVEIKGGYDERLKLGIEAVQRHLAL
jgi:NadR type nicotinamide-nucleotide adenylyltransferase